MQIGALRLVLQACNDMPDESDGWILDVVLARQIGLSLPEVRACIESLDDQRYVHSARLNDGLKVQITADGRLFLSQRRRFHDEARDKRAEPIAIKVVPKGLKSFDDHDADDFLHLLSDYEGGMKLPKSIAFWKSRIDGPDTDRMFRVGVIYGQSGCGKSSMVKAGLLPRLEPRVLKVLLEANGHDTEKRLLEAIHKRCPKLPGNRGLAESLEALQDGQGLAQGQTHLKHHNVASSAVVRS